MPEEYVVDYLKRPPGSIRETEEYQVQLSNVAMLEVVIKPISVAGLLARP